MCLHEFYLLRVFTYFRYPYIFFHLLLPFYPCFYTNFITFGSRSWSEIAEQFPVPTSRSEDPISGSRNVVVASADTSVKPEFIKLKDKASYTILLLETPS